MSVNWGSFNMAMGRALGAGGALGMGTAATAIPEWAAHGTAGLLAGTAVAGASFAVGAAGGFVYSWKRSDTPRDRLERLVDGKKEPRFIAQRLSALTSGERRRTKGPIPVLGEKITLQYKDRKNGEKVPVQLHYYERGRAHRSKGSAILLHGFASQGYQWNQVFDEFTDQYHGIAIDLFGHGFSDCLPNHDYHFIETLPDLLNQFLDELGLTKVSVFGSSLGGGIGQQWAVRNDKRIKQLVLFDSSGCTGRIEPVPFFIKMAHWPLELRRPFALPLPLEELMVLFALWRYVVPTANEISPFDIAQYASPYQFDPHKVWARGIYGDMIRDLSIAIEPQYEYQERQREITQPTLYVYSEWDRTVRPSVPKAITSDIRNSQLLWIPKKDVPTAGHTLMSDTPQLALKIMLDVMQNKGRLLTVSTGQGDEESPKRLLLKSSEAGSYRYERDSTGTVEKVFAQIK